MYEVYWAALTYCLAGWWTDADIIMVPAYVYFYVIQWIVKTLTEQSFCKFGNNSMFYAMVIFFSCET